VGGTKGGRRGVKEILGREGGRSKKRFSRKRRERFSRFIDLEKKE